MESKNTNSKKPQENPRNIDLSKYDLNDTDKRVLLLKLNNVKQIDIAKQLKRKEATISNICNKPEFLKAYNELTSETNKTILEQIKEVQNEALAIYFNLMRDANSELVKKGICENILQFDRLNIGDKNIELPDDLEELSSEQINELYKRIKNG